MSGKEKSSDTFLYKEANVSKLEYFLVILTSTM